MSRFLIFTALIVAITIPALIVPAHAVFAQTGFDAMQDLFNIFSLPLFGQGQADFVEANPDPVAVIIGRILGFILSFIGAVMVGLIVYGGFLWMTARGDPEQVEKGKQIVIDAITGLVIVLLAYAITRVASYFIIRATLPGALPGALPVR